MTQHPNKSENPYQAPSANLRGESEGPIEWTDYTIRCARRFARSHFLGVTFVFFVYLFAKIAIDVFHYGWIEGIVGGDEVPTPLLLFAFSVTSFAGFPFSSLYVYYYRSIRKISVRKFINTHKKQNEWPSVRTIVFLLTAVIGALYLWGEFPNLFELESLLQSDRVRSLWVFGLVTPITYAIMKVAGERTNKILEEMTFEGQR